MEGRSTPWSKSVSVGLATGSIAEFVATAPMAVLAVVGAAFDAVSTAVPFEIGSIRPATGESVVA
ncbi:hypothetical protein ACFQKF_15595 [Halalkalicoccus sp. GCM10025322]